MALDSRKERLRLEKLYAKMAEGELEALAREGADLSDLARELLRAEISRRESNVEVVEVAIEAVNLRGPVTIRRFRDLPAALIAKTILDSAGIECFLADEHIVRMDWFWSNCVGGVKLWVKPADVDAVELLDQDYVVSFVIGGVGEYRQPRCPNCSSFDISFRELIKPTTYISALVLYFAIPMVLLPFKRSGWKCHHCGHEWAETRGPA